MHGVPVINLTVLPEKVMYGAVGAEDDLDEDDVAPAVKAFVALAGKMEVLQTKECKPLRAALHPLVEAHLREEQGSD